MRWLSLQVTPNYSGWLKAKCNREEQQKDLIKLSEVKISVRQVSVSITEVIHVGKK